MTERSSRRDRGFTLPEILIVITISGLVIGVIAGVFSVIVRTLPPTEARTDDARSLLGLSTYLPADVNSTPRIPLGSEDVDGAPFDRRANSRTGCAGDPGGTNVLRLAWTEEYGGSHQFVVSYQLVDNGSNWQLVRVACRGTGPVTTNRLTTGLPDPATNPVSVALRDAHGQIVGVTMTVRTISGETLRVDSNSHNPDETLPPLATVVVDPTTTTTSTTTTTTTTPTTTTDPEASTTTTEATTSTTEETTTTTTIPCTASFVSVNPSSVHNTNNANSNNTANVSVGSLHENVTVTITKSGNCENLGLEYVHDPPSAGWKPFGASSQVVLERSNTEQWQDGSRALRLRNGQGGDILATSTLMIL